MEKGQRCVVCVDRAVDDDRATPLALVLDDLLPTRDAPPLGPDPGLVAGVAGALVRGLAEGRLRTGDGLAERLVLLEDRWTLLGDDGPGPVDPALGATLTALLQQLDPDDTLGIEAWFAGAPPADAERHLVARLAAHLAHERHQIAARAAADRRADATTALRALAARLAAAAPPPALTHAAVHSDGRDVRTAGGAPVWTAGQLDAKAARALARALLGDTAALPLRRWLVAMGRLRVDRALLARR